MSDAMFIGFEMSRTHARSVHQVPPAAAAPSSKPPLRSWVHDTDRRPITGQRPPVRRDSCFCTIPQEWGGNHKPIKRGLKCHHLFFPACDNRPRIAPDQVGHAGSRFHLSRSVCETKRTYPDSSSCVRTLFIRYYEWLWLMVWFL